MRLRRVTDLLPLCCGLSLTACGWFSPEATRPPTVLIKTETQAQPLLTSPTCRQRPNAPAPETATQRDVALFLRELNEWGEECEAKLAEVSEMLRPTQDAP